MIFRVESCVGRTTAVSRVIIIVQYHHGRMTIAGDTDNTLFWNLVRGRSRVIRIYLVSTSSTLGFGSYVYIKDYMCFFTGSLIHPMVQKDCVVAWHGPMVSLFRFWIIGTRGHHPP